MKVKLFIAVFFHVLIGSSLYSDEVGTSNWDGFVEFNQMLAFNVGTEYRFTDKWGLKGAVGTSPLGVTTISYNLMGVYHLGSRDSSWLFDLECGMPLAYFDQIEGRYADNDPVIDDPFAGWLFGPSLLTSYNVEKCTLGIRTGCAVWWENQRDTGWKGPGLIPVITIVLNY